jgi:hypothetical protein
MTSGKTPPCNCDVGYGTPPVHTRFRKGYACPQTQVSRRVNADTDVVEAERMHQFSASGPADAIPCSAPRIPCYPSEQGKFAKALILLVGRSARGKPFGSRNQPKIAKIRC